MELRFCSQATGKAVNFFAFRLFGILLILLLPKVSEAESRSQTVQIMCANEIKHNTTKFDVTMETMSEKMRSRGYGKAVTGSGPDANYGLAQCYGDLSLLDCGLCYAEIRTVLPRCFPFNGGRVYLDGCFMRIQNFSFYDQFLGPEDRHVCGNRSTKGSMFQKTAKRAVQHVVANAPGNNGYGHAEVVVPESANETAYVLAECWKTLSANSCQACLQKASASVLSCLPQSEARALYTGCFMRYSDVNFLNAIPSSGDSSSNGNVVAPVVISAVVVLVVGTVIFFIVCRKKQTQNSSKGSDDVEKFVKALHDSGFNFEYSTLEKATGSFDEANKLGQGGFGTVYKGVLPDGSAIAVKRLFFNNKHRAADFYNEVNIISSVEHKNLVRLLGCSFSGPESLLVYEYLPNLSLDRFIFDPSKGKTLNWEKRFDIIIGTARGLVYLHENTKTRIIHRDIKASNILLDSRLKPKIADFGLARSFQTDKSHISTAIAGTLLVLLFFHYISCQAFVNFSHFVLRGYMAPEIILGQLTEKADVYSFGVLLLEIVAGRQNNRSNSTDYTDNLISIAWWQFQQGRAEELFDPNLMFHDYQSTGVKNEVVRVVHVGLLCVQEAPGLRPSMSKVLQMLVKKEEELIAPKNPPFVVEKTMEPCDTPSNPHLQGISASNASISHSSFYPR